MKRKFNYRKVVLLFADIFIIIVSGLLLNYVLSLVGWIAPETSRTLLLFMSVNILTCELVLVVCGALLVWLRFSGAAVVAGMLGGKPAKEAAAEEAAEEPEGLTVPTAAEEAVAEPTPADVADEVIAAAAPAAVATPAAEEEYEDIFSSAERRDAFNKRDE